MIKGIEASKKSVLKTVDAFGEDILSRMQNAVALETGNINASTSLKANADYNSTLVVPVKVEGDAYIDGKKAGRILAPEITKTIKVAGGK
jgi:hypothetical protein